MKIIRFRKRSTDPWKPRKRALLIGIVYEQQSLKGPHKDVLGLKSLLIRKYGYHEKDIVLLLDDNLHITPTRENILKEMRNLVKGVRPGDNLFFHYSGHGDQVQRDNGDDNEEDGKDEAIIPFDANWSDESWILDDVLHDYLVKPLPVGCRLTAIFDMCHSGTALDLPHYECNKVYVPWMSKGRRVSAFLRNKNVRRNAVDGANHRPQQQGRVHVFRRTTAKEVKQRTVEFDVVPATAKRPQRLAMTSRTASMKVDCDPLPSSSSNDPSLCTVCTCQPDHHNLRQSFSQVFSHINPHYRSAMKKRASTPAPASSPPATLSTCTCKICHKPEHDRRSTRGDSTKTIGSQYTETRPDSPISAHMMSPIPRSMSPETYAGCIGSRVTSPVEEHIRGDVYQVSACLDCQEAFEDKDGVSMTSILIDILDKEPHPTFRNLMTRISHRMYKSACEMHQDLKARKLQRRQRQKRGAASQHPDLALPKDDDSDSDLSYETLKEILEMEPIQEPVLGSSRKLDMDNDRFSP